MLTVDGSQRYILKDGVFFPYLADTAWTMVQRLSRDEIVKYLDLRRRQGFNAVQVSAISEFDGINIPNREGRLPFINGNVCRPDHKYFELISFIADECEARGMVLVLLPYWGDKFNQKWGTGPEIFTPDNSACYGRWLARVIGKRENVIWMLGGDRPIETETHREIIDGTAEGLRYGEERRHLMTYHPCGEASSVMYLRGREYIDYHSIQSGHSFGGFKSEKMVARTLCRGGKPCIDAECFYEDFPLDFNTEWNYRFGPQDIRRRIYKNMLAGAAGHTYGHQSVWCFKAKAEDEYPYDWKTALNRPMANQMKHVNEFLNLTDITSMKPAVSLDGTLMACGEKATAVYIESAEPRFIFFKKQMNFSSLLWFNPSNGEVKETGGFNGQRFTALSPFGQDALLLMLK